MTNRFLFKIRELSMISVIKSKITIQVPCRNLRKWRCREGFDCRFSGSYGIQFSGIACCLMFMVTGECWEDWCGDSVLDSKEYFVSFCDTRSTMQENEILEELSDLYDQKEALQRKKQETEKKIQNIRRRQKEIEKQLHQIRIKGRTSSLEASASDEGDCIVINKKEYRIVRRIGNGGCAVVKLAVDQKTNNKLAVKCCRLTDKNGVADLQREIAVLERIEKLGGHPSLVKLVGVAEDSHFIYVATEMMEGGELYDVIVKYGTLTENVASKLIYDLVLGLAFLHSNNIFHGDIKPENVLLSISQKEAKLADFGSAQMDGLPPELNYDARTTAYCPPELLLGSAYSSSADMWAIGCIIFIVLSGKHPFDPTGRSTRGQIEANIVTKDVSFDSRSCQNLSQSARDVIKRLLSRSADERLTAKELLKHPWVQQHKNS